MYTLAVCLKVHEFVGVTDHPLYLSTILHQTNTYVNLEVRMAAILEQ